MAAGGEGFSVNPAMLNSGAGSSRQAADHANDAAQHLSGRCVSSDMFGGFPAASRFADAARAAHTSHTTMLQGHHENLGTVAGNADTTAAAFTGMDHRGAAAIEAIRCNSDT